MGLPHSKVQTQGVYIFTCLTTGQKYVGSSSQLSFRLKGYLNQTHKNTGKLIPLIKEIGLSEFQLVPGAARRLGPAEPRSNKFTLLLWVQTRNSFRAILFTRSGEKKLRIKN